MIFETFSQDKGTTKEKIYLEEYKHFLKEGVPVETSWDEDKQ